MKKTFLLLSAFLLALSLAAQQPEYASIKLDKKEDYTADVDKAALQAANHVLSTPLDAQEGRKEAAAFLMRWMGGTPGYTFALDQQCVKMLDGKQELLVIYLAGMTKYSLEHPESSKDPKKVKLGAVLSLLEYCRQHHIALSKPLKKMDEAREKGKLEKVLQ